MAQINSVVALVGLDPDIEGLFAAFLADEGYSARTYAVDIEAVDLGRPASEPGDCCDGGVGEPATRAEDRADCSIV